jgi:hypothetical protein
VVCLGLRGVKMAYPDIDEIEDEVIRKELPHYIGGIIGEIRQFEKGGYFERAMIKRQLRRIEDLLDNRIDFEE